VRYLLSSQHQLHPFHHLTFSNHSFLITHLYQFFGALLGCSQYSKGVFTAYGGEGSMYQVHRFMDLNPAQLGYFITQVALAGASFGVAQSDLMTVGTALGDLFGMRCSPPTVVIPAFGPQLQAMCVDGSCPISPNATCSMYEPVFAPKNVTSGMNATAPGSLGGGGAATMTGTMGPSPSMTMAPSASTSAKPAAAGHVEISAVALIAGVFAALLL
jgi:hypothetical protein